MQPLNVQDDEEDVKERHGPLPRRKRDARTAFCYKAAPAFAIFCLMGFGFYAVCIRMALEQVIWKHNDQKLGMAYIIAFIACQFFFWVSYLRCVFSDPGRVPPNDSVPPPDPEKDEGRDEETGRPHAPGFCQKCNCWKPPRAHHCEQCGVIDNCVGHKNQKYFVLMLTWVWIMCLTGAIIILSKFAIYGTDGWGLTGYMLGFCLFFAATYGVALLALAGIHYRYILLNSNSVEGKIYQHKPRDGTESIRNPYFISYWSNWASVCGSNPLLWLLPAPVYSTPGDGIHWETSVELPEADALTLEM